MILFGFDDTITTEDILRSLLKTVCELCHRNKFIINFIVLLQSLCHIGIYFGNKDLGQTQGQILLPYSGKPATCPYF